MHWNKMDGKMRITKIIKKLTLINSLNIKPVNNGI